MCDKRNFNGLESWNHWISLVETVDRRYRHQFQWQFLNSMGQAHWSISSNIKINGETLSPKRNKQRFNGTRPCRPSDSLCIWLLSGTISKSSQMTQCRLPNHTLITTNHQAPSIYNQTKIAGWFPVISIKHLLPHV